MGFLYKKTGHFEGIIGKNGSEMIEVNAVHQSAWVEERLLHLASPHIPFVVYRPKQTVFPP
jgi:hypothetical protein